MYSLLIYNEDSFLLLYNNNQQVDTEFIMYLKVVSLLCCNTIIIFKRLSMQLALIS